MREIKFYKNTSGQCPVQDFIRALPTKEREKLLWVLALVRDIQMVPQEYFKKAAKHSWNMGGKSSACRQSIQTLGFLG